MISKQSRIIFCQSRQSTIIIDRQTRAPNAVLCKSHNGMCNLPMHRMRETRAITDLYAIRTYSLLSLELRPWTIFIASMLNIHEFNDWYATSMSLIAWTTLSCLSHKIDQGPYPGFPHLDHCWIYLKAMNLPTKLVSVEKLLWFSPVKEMGGNGQCEY